MTLKGNKKMLKKIINKDIKLTVAQNKEVKERKFEPKTIAELEGSGFLTLSASVPGNFELDLLRAGVIDEPYYSTNPIKMQKWEATHLWYHTTFDFEEKADINTFLVFEGLDTIADIYLNGEKIGHTENMFIAHEFCVPNLRKKGNELVIHITPATIYARKFRQPAMVNGQPYNCDSLAIRKSAAAFGWDIMPRLVSAGIWREMYVIQKPAERIEDFYLFTHYIESDGTARIVASCYINSDEDYMQGASIEITGTCGDSTFSMKKDLFDANVRLACIQKFKLWYPKNYGEQNLYDVTVRLYRDGEVKDEKKLRFGVRTIELERSSTIEENGGEFVFKINGKRIFILGTNFVPLSPYHSEDKSRYQRALEMVDDIGCNAIRCWGGNVYEDHEFFDYCDEKGILVWQDFMMGCGVYPHDDRFVKQIEEEATFIVRKLRNHASIFVWAGDNECDMMCQFYTGHGRDPNRNIITRKVLSDVIYREDHVRPYLPSSPFVDEYAFKTKKPLPEDHLWGPRDYFKGDFYRNAVARFASEIGYHGCPSVKSLKKFIKPEKLWPIFDEKGMANDDWLAHATALEFKEDAWYVYRIKLMAEQVETLFGFIPDNLPLFSMLSMISQAEAKKYFIESFRIGKCNQTGIIWWNLLDGWPQISDAVVDFYYEKKLAYDYIKRAQAPVCFMFDVPIDAKCGLYGVNDTIYPFEGTCAVVDVETEQKIFEEKVVIPAGRRVQVGEVFVGTTQKCYYITWVNDKGVRSENHYYSNMPKLNYEKYLTEMRQLGFVGELEDL